MHKRIFISIPIPEEWRKEFADFGEQFSARDVRWTVKENIHITACFLGDVDAARIGEIKEKLAQLCARIKPFEVSFDRMDFAPPGMPPRMVWAVFQESAGYAELVEKMREALKEFFSIEPHKELIAHATLARFKDSAIARAIDVVQSQPVLSSFDVRTVELVESHLDPAGVRHEILETFPLGARMRTHEILSHTADVRLKAEGSSREELFRAALEGMADIQNARITKHESRIRKDIKIQASDQTALLIDFLSEALTQSQIEKAVFDEVVFSKLTSGELEAEISGERAEGFEEDIKAVTYHGAEIKKNDKDNYEVTVLFDI